jgi:hypothetical protein
MTRGTAIRNVSAILGGLLFVYLASFGPVVAKAGFMANGNWFNLMRPDRTSFAVDALPNYAPIFWVCRDCPFVNDVMFSYVGICFSCFRSFKISGMTSENLSYLPAVVISGPLYLLSVGNLFLALCSGFMLYKLVLRLAASFPQIDAGENGQLVQIVRRGLDAPDAIQRGSGWRLCGEWMSDHVGGVKLLRTWFTPREV